MKNKLEFIMVVFAAAVLMATASCNNNKPEDTKDTAESRNDAKFENKTEEKDAQFLVDATSISMEEIELGKLAQEKGTSEEVKKLGQMMVADHQKALDEVRNLAGKKSITVPAELTDKVRDDYKKFSDKSAKDFDMDYCDKMVDGHKDAISKFEKASTDCADQEIKDWASTTLPVLRKHLDHAMACKENCKRNK